MYFNLIEPMPTQERGAAHEWVDGPYAEHQWLWRFFPAEPGSPRDFLFRRRDDDAAPKFYVVSKRPAQAPSGAWRIQSRAYTPAVPAGTRLSFDLRVNPVITHTVDGKSTRHDVVMEAKKQLLGARGMERWEDWKPDRRAPDGQPDPRPGLYELVHSTCAAWLNRRAADHGFAIDADSLAVEAYQQQRGGKKDQLRFSTVDFRGHLTVIDPEKFAHALHSGIGPAKAFGCGLLLVRRPD